jgi:radical SAM superfamily enzyme YgiQ (UPF0313 family)
MKHRRSVVLVQLPIPQLGIEPQRGNVPLAAAYLALYARRQGLDADFDVQIVPGTRASRLSDAGLVAEILAREPFLVGFTCYLWNVERSLDVARRVRAARPDVRILLGGPEVTSDNDWLLQRREIDYAALGEGEQTFAELLAALRDGVLAQPIPGLFVPGQPPPAPRAPLRSLDAVASPYLEGLLDAGEERILLLETLRGCVFKCKFCFYPKSYDDLYSLSEEHTKAALEHACAQGVREVTLLDPTLNQGRDFKAFVDLLARCNPGRTFTYFGELRAEGLDDDIAARLRDANFTEVEIGLQSVDPRAGALMDRRNNLKAVERGVRALLAAGIRVKMDLIVGLPGDTVDSVRRGIEWLRASGLYTDVQVFNLAILPGTAFRQEAKQLGLEYQPRPPYHVLRTPSFGLEDLYALMEEAEDAFDTEFEPMPPPALPAAAFDDGIVRLLTVDLDAPAMPASPSPAARAQALTLHLRAGDFSAQVAACERWIEQSLAGEPHTTLQVVLEPRRAPGGITPAVLERLQAACYAHTNYLDRMLAILPGPMKGSKRLVILLDAAARATLPPGWSNAVGDWATIAWRGTMTAGAELQAHECTLR